MVRISIRLALSVLVFLAVTSPAVRAQTCYSGPDMDAQTRAQLEAAARKDFEFASKGDAYSLRQSAVPSLAATFGNIEAVVIEQKADYADAQANVRQSYLLEAPGTAPIARAEFLCGVWPTPEWATFVINNLPPGRYGLVILEVSTRKGPYVLSLVLKQEQQAWKLAGYYSKPAQVGGKDGKWFLGQARSYKARGQVHNAWFYYLTAWDLQAPVDFIGTRELDRMAEEMQGARPADLPSEDKPFSLSAGGRTYQVIYLGAVPVGSDLDMLVKYRSDDISNTQRTFEDNMAVIKALVARYPEFREAFAGVVARAVEPSGRDYGTLLAMKDVK